ncbi:MAG: zinc-binding dehydrogenase [Myxococcales bacterium]|nr:NADPH:quinone oxidoreductase family protein [Myxococcales bacterium]HIM00392.1 NADPH:quinone oxidoreductase family protein [Myxococcales bacterium]
MSERSLSDPDAIPAAADPTDAATRALPEFMQAWRVHAWGPDPNEAMALDTIAVPTPAAGELLVRAQAIPLNLNDMERINGENMMVRPELPVTPGMEVMGVVVACGDGVEEWLGRRVVAMPKLATGGFAEYSICPVVSSFEMPEDIPLPAAAALYFPYHLAWLGLVDRAALEAGESVLIHAAAGGSGSAAIQLAKHIGATVYATAGSDEKVELCRELGADVAINYSREDFQSVVLEATHNKGVDVVFDNVGEAVMEKSMNCVAYNGRYLMMGFASDKRFADEKLIVPRRVLMGNMKLSGVLMAYANDVVAPMMKKAMGWNFCPDSLGQEIMARIVELVRAKKLKPVIGETTTFDAIPAAMARMRDRKTTGRVVVLVD